MLAFETAIAKVSWPAADRRDIDKINNPMSVAELQTYAPGLNWDAFLTGAAHRATATTAIVQREDGDPATSPRSTRRRRSTTLKAWEAFHVTDQAAPYLSKRFVDSRFTFTKTLSGVTELRPRWKRGAALIDSSLGELLGHTYVDTYFPASSKAMMTELVANLKTAMAARIQNSDWMSAETKKAALEKLVEDGRDGRLSRQVARLFEAEDRRRPTSTATSSDRAAFEWDYQLDGSRQAGRSQEVGA